MSKGVRSSLVGEKKTRCQFCNIFTSTRSTLAISQLVPLMIAERLFPSQALICLGAIAMESPRKRRHLCSLLDFDLASFKIMRSGMTAGWNLLLSLGWDSVCHSTDHSRSKWLSVCQSPWTDSSNSAAVFFWFVWMPGGSLRGRVIW